MTEVTEIIASLMDDRAYWAKKYDTVKLGAKEAGDNLRKRIDYLLCEAEDDDARIGELLKENDGLVDKLAVVERANTALADRGEVLIKDKDLFADRIRLDLNPRIAELSKEVAMVRECNGNQMETIEDHQKRERNLIAQADGNYAKARALELVVYRQKDLKECHANQAETISGLQDMVRDLKKEIDVLVVSADDDRQEINDQLLEIDERDLKITGLRDTIAQQVDASSELNMSWSDTLQKRQAELVKANDGLEDKITGLKARLDTYRQDYELATANSNRLARIADIASRRA